MRAARVAAFAGALGLLAFCSAGCKLTGGGSLAGYYSGKATFGFQLRCDNTGALGQIDYYDPSYPVRLHGVSINFGCEGSSSNGLFVGQYTPQPNPLGAAGQGSFTVYVEDNGVPGPSAGDFFRISLSGGAYDGYSNSGPILSGNITGH